MTEIKAPLHVEEEKNPIAEIRSFWEKYGRVTTYAASLVLLIAVGYFGYKYLVSEPNEKKASEAMFRAESYYRMDSSRLALQGDNLNLGFLKIMSKYSGTRAANLATFYAGSCYLKLGDYTNAIKYLKQFSTSVLQMQARTYGLMGDAYAELNKKEEAVNEYKKAGTVFDKDDVISPEYLFRAGLLYETMGKYKDAIAMYQMIKDKYPSSPRGFDVDRYLARLGVTR